MLKKLLSIAFMCLISATAAFAQSSTVSGTITDAETGEPLPQVNVFVSELQVGDATDFNGEYTIENVAHGTYTLRITSIGYVSVEQQITVNANNDTFNFALQADVQALEDVVVTAYGLDREQRSLGYSVQEVSGDVVNRVDQGNVVGALAGKVAGVQVIGSAGANIGGSERIRIRGANGLSVGSPVPI